MDIPGPKLPEPPASVQEDQAKLNAWALAWQKTDEAKAFQAAYEAHREEMSRQPSLLATIARDGTFRIDDVLPGKYVMSLGFNQDAAGTMPEQRFVVPASGTDRSQPIELGVLRLQETAAE